MKRICCFCERWASGGIESFLFNILTHMDLSGLEVDIVAAQMSGSVFTQRSSGSGVCFVELSGDRRDLRGNCLLFRKLLRERQYDVVHLNVFHGLSLYYAKLAAEAGVPVRIAHAHNTALRKSRTKAVKMAVHRWAKERYTRYATDLWGCSKDAAEFLFSQAELDKRGFDFIPNGIDTERFRFDLSVRTQLRRELGLEGRFVIGNVGRLCGQKNQSFLLDVFARIHKVRPDSVLLLVGGGEDLPMLERKARMLALEDPVIFYGETDRVERPYWAMDVFAFPSLFEGLPISLVEAQAAGLPVTCSECVPDEAVLTPSVRKIGLSQGADCWAESLLGHRPDTAERGAASGQVQRSGFAVGDVAGRIRDFYMGLKT